VSADGADYSEAFRRLRADIDADIDRLREGRIRVYRPPALFLTLGPGDDPGAPWGAEVDRQFSHDPETREGNRRAPTFISIALGTGAPRVHGPAAHVPELGLERILSPLLALAATPGPCSPGT